MSRTPHSLLQLAVSAHRKGDIATAEDLYAKLLRRSPQDFRALQLFGALRAQQRKFAEADRLLARALEIDINSEALNNHGAVLVELGRHDEAITRLNRALMMKPDYADAHFNLGNALRISGQMDRAVHSFYSAVALRPGFARAHQNLGATLRDLGRHAEAISAVRRALELEPRSAELHSNLGILLRDTGKLEESRRMFERTIALDPGFFDAYYYLVRSDKVRANDGLLPAMEALAPKAIALPPEERARFHFALGKAYEDIGRYDEAFANLLTANRAVRASIDYDEQKERAYCDRIKAIFTAEFLAERAGSGSPSALPIFIVGFARSGTTLTEQILASHPKVHGAGELTFLLDASGDTSANDRGIIEFPESVPLLDAQSLRRLGDGYVERLGRIDPAATHVTDKSMGSVALLGLIRLILPRAKIIHVQRDPVDTCLSCFALHFAGNAMGYSYDLGELGRTYRLHQEMMEHWRRVLPPDAMLEVRYENIVENLEAEARRIVAYCGLDWDDRCLAFHETERTVRTASVTQVRQPIYRSSVQRWRRYERHLGPLLEALGLSPTDSERRVP